MIAEKLEAPVPSSPNFEGDSSHSRESFDTKRAEYMAMMTIPEQYPTLEAAYESLGDDPRFAPTEVPITESGATFNEGLGHATTGADKIAMSYFMKDVGPENLRSIMTSWGVQQRKSLLDSMLSGNIEGTIRQIVEGSSAYTQQEKVGPIAALEAGRPVIHGIDDTTILNSVAKARYSRDVKEKLKTLGLITSAGKSPEYAEHFVRESFNALAGGERLPTVTS